jgi:chemotaxis protein histidine kinase CheA
MSLTYEFIKEQIGLKVKFKTEEQLYALLDLLTAHLPPRAAPEPVTKPKIKKAKKATSAILEPVDADTSVSMPAVTLGAMDSLRDNKYRLQVLNPELCLARKIDKENPVPGTRPGDIGAKIKFYPELQCSKRPVAGGSLCTICARKEAEYLGDTSKVNHGWFGRLDEPLFAKAGVVGCDAFWAKYPEGVAEASVPAPLHTQESVTAAATAAATAAEKPKKVKKAKVVAAAEEPVAAVASQEPEKSKKVKKVKVAAEPDAAAPDAAAQEPVAEKSKKVKKVKVAAAPDAAAPDAAAPDAAAPDAAAQEPVAEKPKKVKKVKVAAVPDAVAQEPVAEKPKKVKKVKVAAAPDAAAPDAAAQEPVAEKSKKVKKAVATNGTATAVEWITFLHEGIPLIRHTKTNNCYQCDRSKHRLEEMVMRDKFEGKWREGRLDPYAEEDEE